MTDTEAFLLEMADISRRLSEAQFPNDSKSITALVAVSLMALIHATGDSDVAEHCVSEIFELLRVHVPVSDAPLIVH